MDVRTVPFGPEATAALADAVARAQAADSLAPVTVIVPSNYAGLAVRRLLASSENARPGSAPGLVNVTFATPYQVAAQIGAVEVVADGSRPLSAAVLAAAVRSVLLHEPGYFTPVAGHAATETSLIRLYTELSRVRPEHHRRLIDEGSERTRELIRLHDAIAARLRGFHNEDDLARAAIAAVQRSTAEVESLGAIILFVPERLSPSLSDFINALAQHRPSEVILGVTGDRAGDRAALRDWAQHLDRLGSTDRAVAPLAATSIIEAADSDDEVRSVVRAIMTQLEHGVPAHRIAVFYPTADPYARALIEQFDTAGLPFNGPSGRTLASSFAGRVLLRLVSLAVEETQERHFSRDAIIDLATAGPLRGPDGQVLRSSPWDDVSRRAGVVGGIEDWDQKLTRYTATSQRKLESRINERTDGQTNAIHRELDQTNELAGFVARLAQDLDRETLPSTWRELTALFRRLLHQFLPAEPDRQRWPEVEVAAAADVDAVLDRLSILDTFDPNPTPTTLLRAIGSELDSPSARIGRFGNGVTVGPLASAPGLDFEVVVLVGMAEGLCPAPRREDMLLPDDERRKTNGDLELRINRIHLDHRSYLAAIASGSRERILLLPKGDHRSGRKRLPSRWLLDTASALTGATVLGSDWVDVDHPNIYKFASFQDGLLRSDTLASADEVELRHLARRALDGFDVTSEPLPRPNPELAAGFATIEGRRSLGLSRFDGLVGGPSDGGGGRGRSVLDNMVSASQLETWATCPMRYFLGYELGLGRLDRPELIVQISALDQGSLWHEILERFLRPITELEADERPAPGDAWSDADRERLRSIAEAAFEQYRSDGLTGQELLWRLHRESVVRELDAFLAADELDRRRYQRTPESVEMAIGADGAPPAIVDLQDGRVARLRGFADRIDRTTDGTPVVIDYKTGRKAVTQAELDKDPVQQGTKLQLAVYAEAAQQRFGSDAASALYWYTSARERFTTSGFELTKTRRQRFVEVLKLIADGIDGGVFPMHSGAYNDYFQHHANCRYCDFDSVCPRDRHEQVERIVADPNAVAFVELAGRPVDLSEDADE